MKKSELSLEQKGRYDAYSRRGGFTYDHQIIKGYPCDTQIWHYLKDVQKMEFNHVAGPVTDGEVDPNDVAALEARAKELKGAASYMKRIAKLEACWGTSPGGLLTKLLGKVATLKPLPRNSGIYILRADESSDDLSWGPGAWSVGMIAAQKTRGALMLDVHLGDALLEDKDTRQQATGFAAGAVAMQCIGYDRGKKYPLRSVTVQPAPNMEFPFTEFDYTLEMLQRDQQTDIAALGSFTGNAMQAGLAAVKAVHEEELARLGYGI